MIGLAACLISLVSGATTQPLPWEIRAEGQLLLRQFEYAPFPHDSRRDGWTNSKSEHFDRSAYLDSTIGIFIPKGYEPVEAIDFVVHLHGHRNHVARVIKDFELIEQLTRSGVKAILIVPQGPLDVPDSSSGKLADAGGFERMMKEIAAFLKQDGKSRTDRVGRVVLSAHSGGYGGAAAILANGGLSEEITDVLLFDASYGGIDSFADWIAAGMNRRLISVFTPHLAAKNFELLNALRKRDVGYESFMSSDLSERLMGQRRAILIHTNDLAHDDVVHKTDYLSLFLKSSALGISK